MHIEQRLQHKMKGLGVGDIGPMALAVGIAVIIVAVTSLILANFSTASNNANFTAVVGLGLTAITNFAGWFNIIVIVVVAVIILSLVFLLKNFGGGGA